MITEPKPTTARQEWLKQRQSYIGGSDAAAILGVDEMRQAFEVWEEKRGLRESFAGNRMTRRGNHDEAFVASEYELEFPGVQLVETKLIRDKERPWLAANPDRYAICRETGRRSHGVELKISDDWEAWGPDGSDKYPPRYYVQVQQYLYITKLPFFHLVVLLPRGDLRVYKITLDEAYIEAHLARLDEFWECVEKETPPEIDFEHESALQCVCRRIGRAEGVGDISDEFTKLAAKAEKCRLIAKAAERRAGVYKSSLVQLMGEREQCRIGDAGWKISRTFVAPKPPTKMPKQRTPYWLVKISAAESFKLANARLYAAGKDSSETAE